MSSDEIEWEMKGGTPPKHVQAVYDDEGEGGMVIVGGPDWMISLPELGSKKLYIKGYIRAEISCPACSADGPIPVILLEENMFVSCCEKCGQYGWFENSKEMTDET